MIKALTEKMPNGREENGQNVRNVETSLLSDSNHAEYHKYLQLFDSKVAYFSM